MYVDQCANCHGEQLQGDESISAADLKSAGFRKGWSALPLTRLFDLFDVQPARLAKFGGIVLDGLTQLRGVRLARRD